MARLVETACTVWRLAGKSRGTDRGTGILLQSLSIVERLITRLVERFETLMILVHWLKFLSIPLLFICYSLAVGRHHNNLHCRLMESLYSVDLQHGELG